MRKNFTLLFLAFSLLISVLGVKQGFSVSAYPYPVDVKQSDGSIIKIILQGDEKVKWGQTMDGYTIVYNKNGDFEYGMLDSKGDLVPSGYLVTEETNKNLETKNFLSKTPKGLTYSKDQVSMILQIWDINEKEGSKAFPTTGSRKLICILIGFKDKAFTKTKTDFENLFNQVGYSTGGATGSVKDYYLENSYGQFNLTVDVAGPYTASQNMSYYGGNDASGNDLRPRELVLEAVNFADPTINFANYDNDNDGTVDGVYLVYAGYGEEAGGGANAIWAHAWNISPVVKDGKTISKYSCSAELRGNSGTTITAIGVICHEFGHVLGAPDYYDTNYATGGQFEGTGTWDMMASGSWNNNGVTPAHHNAFTKIYIYNWATATTLTSAANITVLNAAENKSFFRINTATSGEYFLLENREKHLFDAYVPGSGLIIYHVHSGVMTSASSNSVNNTHQQRMYPKVASATTNPTSTPSSYGSVNSAGCPWPGTSNKTSFTDATTPHMKSWAGANTAKPMTNIARNATAKTVTFAFMGGGTSVTVPTVSTSSITSITTNSATGGGNVTATGGATVTARGICYSTSQNPTIANSTVASGSGTGTYTANMTGLAAGTTYYVRAYATNSAGTAYGTQVSFTTTASATLPTVSTSTISSITSSSATGGGNVTAAGSSSVSARGICYSTSQNPTIANSRVVSGSGTGTFSANMTGLAANTTYYVRAYATNTSGTAYGNQVSFTTTAAAVAYCASKGSNSTYEWIDLVQFAGINRTSGNDGGYKDMTSLTGTVVRGQVYPIYFSAGFQGTAYTEYWAIWIDFNKNGTFEDSEKMVSGSSSSSGNLTANITIPTSAVLGTTRMRVSMKYNAAQTACETFSYGEVEDYTINITASSSAPINFDNNAELLGNELIEPYLVYPNPATDRISIKTVGIEGNVTIRIYNTNGQIVRELISLDCLTNVEIGDLPKGVYIISVDEEKEPIKKRFVKL
jgi:M6 family metalloprotease-like protein